MGGDIAIGPDGYLYLAIDDLIPRQKIQHKGTEVFGWSRT